MTYYNHDSPRVAEHLYTRHRDLLKSSGRYDLQVIYQVNRQLQDCDEPPSKREQKSDKSEGDECFDNFECSSYLCSSNGVCEMNEDRTVLNIGFESEGSMKSGDFQNDDLVAVSRAFQPKSISGKSQGIGGVADSLVFAKQTLGSNTYLANQFEIEVLILKSSATFVGLMVRENEEAGSKHFSAIMTENEGAKVMYRSIHGGVTTSINFGACSGTWGVNGVWLKIVRFGENLRAYCMINADMEEDLELELPGYELLGEVSIMMDKAVHVGIFVAMGGSEWVPGVVEFDNYSLKVRFF